MPYEIAKSELRRLTYVQSRYVFWIAWPIFALLGLSYFFSTGTKHYGLGIFLIAYLPVFLVVFTEWSIHRSKVLDRTISVALDDKILHVIVSSGSESRNVLTDFHRIREVCGYFLLYVNRFSFFIIPDRAFRSYEDKEEFWRCVAEEIPASKPPKSVTRLD